MKDNNFLRTEPVGKLLVKLSVPTVTAAIINMLYNLVDRVYIGHIPEVGAMALTGVGICFPIIMIVSAFAAFISSGGAPRASISLGKQDKESAERILGNCFVLQIVISITITALLLIFGEKLLLLFGASSNTIGYAVSYMKIYALGTIFVELTLGMNAFITAQGNTKISMMSVLIGAICNIILDPIFIFALRMGVRGAALATVISQALSTVWVLSYLFGKHTQIKLRKCNMRLSGNIVGPVFALGSAAFMMQSSESIINICYNSSLLKYGGDIAVGTMTILTSVMQLAFLPTQGIGQGAQPIISYNYGANDKDRVKSAFAALLKADLGYTLIFAGLVIIFPSVFVGLFTNDPEMKAYASRMLRVYMAAMPLFGIQMAAQMTFTSIGYAKNAIIVACMRKFILILPLIYILPAIMKSNQTFAVFLSEPISDLISVIFSSTLFYFSFRGALKAMDSKSGLQTK